jgi:hypothetical protein
MAVRRTTLVTLVPGMGFGSRAAVVGALEAATRSAMEAGDVLEAWVRPTMPGVVRGGDLIWHVAFADRDGLDRWLASTPRASIVNVLGRSPVLEFTSATYDEGRTGTRVVAVTRPVHRSLVMRVEADDATLARFEAELFAMGEHIPVMCEWRLSQVTGSEGPTGWTHVWEQRFPDPRALEHTYLRHPYHWGQVDRWFDGEGPHRIVRPGFRHTFCLIQG